jgi:anti-sigma B factor antagonist
VDPDRDEAAIDAATEMSDATARVRERAWLIARASRMLPRQHSAGTFRRESASGDVARDADGVATFATVTHLGYVVLTATGQLDMRTASALRRHLFSAIDVGRPLVVVDLLQVDFIDSGGLGVLVAGLKRARYRGASVRVVATRPEFVQLFQVTGVYKVLPLYESVMAASTPGK